MKDTLEQEKNGNYGNCERCVFCGKPVPEGVEVCPICRAQFFNVDSNEYSE